MDCYIHKTTYKRLSFTFITLLLLMVSSVASSKETITVVGTSSWCTGPGTEVIYTPEGQLNECGCSEGYDEIDPPDDDGEPLCGFDFGDEDTDGNGSSEPPSGGGGGTGKTPSKPTPQQCQSMNEECMRNASALTQDCRDGRTKFNQEQLANGNPCHDQSLEDLLDGFRYRVLWMTYACMPDDFRNVDNAYTDNCRKQAIRRGLDRCQFGIDASSSSTGQSQSSTFSFKSPIFEAGGDNSHETSFTISTPFGIGDNQICMAKGAKAIDQCSSDLSACNAAASGQPGSTESKQASATAKTTVKSKLASMKASIQDSAVNLPDKIAPPSLAERLMSQIDVVKLGLNDEHTPVATRLFRPLANMPLEIPLLHIRRLQFLADWSSFLKRHSVSDAKMQAMHEMLQKEQFSLQSEYFTEAAIVESVFAVNMQTGEVGSDAVRELLEMYRSRDGLRRQMVFSHFRVLQASKDMFGETIGADFNENVWPGMLAFGFSAPFAVQINSHALSSPKPKSEEPVAK